MAFPGSSTTGRQTNGSASKLASNVNVIAGASSISQERSPEWDFSAAHHIGNDVIETSQITSGNGCPMMGRKPQQSSVEAVHPLPAALRGNRKRNKTQERLAAHGGQIG